ncbi:SGNH/GDSL hydrolase family protein [Dyella subtropica]|uniref:SGNH/GDSL hydrolase family protein n=1 Tax=Dyella subtropica TaxID=2992127 RepID=UPI0022508673|nr:SGNH/GDSL hydrolase family protein [Dyella subtropica]
MSKRASQRGTRTFHLLGRVIACMALVVLLSAACVQPPWFATWYAAPQNYNILFPGITVPPQSISNQSVRQIVHTSHGGSLIRVKLSNFFGTTPVTFGEARIARSTGNGGVDLATDHRLRFGGDSSVTLAPGEERWSDPVYLQVPTQSDLAISLYVPLNTPVVTTHTIGMQTNYLSPGNQVGAATMGSSTPSDSYYWLSEVDASTAGAPDGVTDLAAHPYKVVVAFGDSITDGYGSTPNANHRWPNYLDNRVQAAADDLGRVSVVNAAIAGNRWIYDGVGPAGVTRFAHDVAGVSGATHVLILLGINDIGIGELIPQQNVSADQIIAAMQATIAQANASGIKIYLATITPYNGASYYDAAGEMKREAVNAFVRSENGADGVLDFDRIVRDPSNPTALLPAYDAGDHLHPNDVGYQAMANSIDLGVLED